MSVTQTNIAPLHEKLQITLQAEDYKPKYTASLKDYKKKAQIKGFRKGQVPVAVVEKMVGKNLLADELMKALQEKLGAHIQENKIQYLGEPLLVESGLEDVDVKADKAYDFAFEIGLRPEFTIPVLENKESFDTFDIEVGADMIEKELEHLKEQYGEVEQVEKIKEGDSLFVELNELENGEIKAGGFFGKGALEFVDFKFKKNAKVLVSKKKEDAVDIELSHFKDQAAVLKRFNEEYAGEELNQEFRITVKHINRVKPAEFNEDFFKKIDPTGEEVTSQEELEGLVKKNLSSYLQEQNTQFLNNRIIEAIMEGTEIELPAAFLKKWLVQSSEEYTEDNVEERYEEFTKGLKWNLVYQKSMVDGEIKITQEDLQEEAKRTLETQMGMRAEGNEEQFNQFIAYMMNNKEFVDKTADTIREKKVFNYLRENVTLVEQTIDFDTFKAKLEGK